MAQNKKVTVNYSAFLVAGMRALDIAMEFARPYGTYLRRSRTHTDADCSHCLGEARDLLRKLEKAAGVTIVDQDLSLEDMATVCDIIDSEARKASSAISLAK